MRKLLGKMLIFGLLLSLLFTLPAMAAVPDTGAHAVLLADLETGNILYAKNPDEKVYPASTTKLMTALLAMESCDLSEKVVGTANASWGLDGQSTRIYIADGEEFTLAQLMDAMLIVSANDAANTIAEHISGSIDAFVEKMNARAKELGATNTHFMNPSGMHHDDHYTTIRDLALIAREVQKYPEIMSIVGKSYYEISPTNKFPETRLGRASNHLINPASGSLYYPYATGLKTGYTEKAKFCLVATAEKDGMKLLSVLTGCEAREDGSLGAKALFEYGFENFEQRVLYKAGDVVTSLPIRRAEVDEIPLVAATEISLLTLRGEADPDVEIVTEKRAVAPVDAGTKLGTLTLQNSAEAARTFDLVAKETYVLGTWSKFWRTIGKILSSWIFYVVLIVVVVFLKIRSENIKRRRRRALRRKRQLEARQRMKL